MSDRYFVGREAEREQFDRFLRDEAGQAAVVIGHEGLGKTELVKRVAASARDHPDLKCGAVRYEVTKQTAVATTLSLMMDHAFEAAQAEEGSLAKTDRRRQQWAALFETVIPKGDKLLKLYRSLRRDPQRDPRDQFLERLELISGLMLDHGRTLFIVDPEKYMSDGSQDEWRLIVRALPAKVKFIFTQRPEDRLAGEYGNLGLIYKDRGDLNQARALWTKASALYKQIGIPHMEAKVRAWIDALPDE